MKRRIKFSGFWDANRTPNLGQKIRSGESWKKKGEKRTSRIEDFAGNLKKYKKVKISTNTWTLQRSKKKLWKTKMAEIPIEVTFVTVLWKSLERGLEVLRNQTITRYHLDYCIVQIGQNTHKSRRDPKRLAVIPTLEKNHQQTLVWKTRKE